MLKPVDGSFECAYACAYLLCVKFNDFVTSQYNERERPGVDWINKVQIRIDQVSGHAYSLSNEQFRSC